MRKKKAKEDTPIFSENELDEGDRWLLEQEESAGRWVKKEEVLPVREEDRKIVSIASGISESIALIAERYARRALDRPTDVNLPPRVGYSRKKKYLLKDLPEPYKGSIESMAKGSETPSISEFPIEEAKKRRQQNEEYLENKDIEPRILPISEIIRGIANRGVENRSISTAHSSEGLFPTAETLQAIPSVSAKDPLIEVHLTQYYPFKQLVERIRTILSIRYNTIPYYLDPAWMDTVLIKGSKLDLIPSVPKSSAIEFIKEVRTNQHILQMISGLSILLNKREARLRKFYDTSIDGPEGGHSERA